MTATDKCKRSQKTASESGGNQFWWLQGGRRRHPWYAWKIDAKDFAMW